MKTAGSLKLGEKGIIQEISSKELGLKLMEMGCYPGNEIILQYQAPLGDPICFIVAGYSLALRKSEAELIIISKAS
jgi:ferrous iron transport protein A